MSLNIELLKLSIPPEIVGNQQISELREVIDFANPIKYLSNITGWRFKKLPILVEQGDKSNFYVPDKVTVNFTRGRILVGSIMHEALHLLLRQNDWLEKYPEIVKLAEKYPILNISKNGTGYPIEQMMAYLLQRDIDNLVGTYFNDPLLKNWGDEMFFEMVIKKEYTYENKPQSEKYFLINVGKTIISLWDSINQTHALDLFIPELISNLNS